MLTLGDAKNSRLRRISGVCPDSPEFLEFLNDSTRMLMRRGNFWATVQRMNACVYSNCITWPRYVGTILGVNNCGSSIPPKNHWYGFSAVLPEDVSGFCRDKCWGAVAIRESGTSSVFNPIPCLNDRYVRFYPSQPTDVAAGRTVTVFGIDGNGQTIRSKRTDGTYQDGVVLPLAIPFVQTSFLVRRVDRILKDQTDGPVRGYQFDGSTLYDLASYDASETAPDYLQSTIVAGCAVTTRTGCCPAQLTGLVKLAFVPVKFDDDLVGIENIDALAAMMQAVKQSDSYSAEEFRKQQMLAIGELNAELRDRLPLDATPVNFKPFGTASLNRVRVGRMI